MKLLHTAIRHSDAWLENNRPDFITKVFDCWFLGLRIDFDYFRVVFSYKSNFKTELFDGSCELDDCSGIVGEGGSSLNAQVRTFKAKEALRLIVNGDVEVVISHVDFGRHDAENYLGNFRADLTHLCFDLLNICECFKHALITLVKKCEKDVVVE